MYKEGLVNTPKCERCKQVSEMAGTVVCDCDTLATLRPRHLSQHIVKSDDLQEIFISRILYFVQNAGLGNA